PSVPVLFRRVPHIRRRHSGAELASQGRFPARGSLEAALCAHAKHSPVSAGRSSRSEYGLQSISPHIHWAFLLSTSHSISTLPLVLEPLTSLQISLHDEIGQKKDIIGVLKASHPGTLSSRLAKFCKHIQVIFPTAQKDIFTDRGMATDLQARHLYLLSGFLPFSYDDPAMNYQFSSKNPSSSSQPSVSFILDDCQDSVRFRLLPLFNDLSAECPSQHHRSVPLSTVRYHRY
ncbi:hypothetical protein BGY98DRAFT_959205, partial [Russula aff. rugulosa BPL654]